MSVLRCQQISGCFFASGGCVQLGDGLNNEKAASPEEILPFGTPERTLVNYGAASGNAGRQQSTGLLHLDGLESDWMA